MASDLLRARLRLFPPPGFRLEVSDVVVVAFRTVPREDGAFTKVPVPHRKVVLRLFDDDPKPIPTGNGGFLIGSGPETVGLWVAGRFGAGETRDPAARATLAAWRAAGFPITGVLTVVKAALAPELRGKGYGVAAYLHLADIAAAHGDAIQAHAAETGTSLTSDDALYAWASLGRLGVASGVVAWAGPRPSEAP